MNKIIKIGNIYPSGGQNGNIYDSILEASEALGVNYATLWNQLKGRRKNKLGVREYE